MAVEFDTCKPSSPMPFEKKFTVADDYYERFHVVKNKQPDLGTHWMRELNKNNDCKYFKRKWWKFWIKEVK